MIKKYIPSLWKMKIKSIISNSDKYKNIDKNKKKVIIALAADYGNLGDVAITYAQKEFLKNCFKGYEIIEFLCNDIVKEMKSLKRKINKNDIITIVGGGNIGDLYQGIEDQRKYLIKNFKKNIIISFPQTIDFSDNDKGEKSKRHTQKIYNKHRKMLIFARERKTYLEMKKIFSKCIVEEMPDIVLYLNEKNDNIQRSQKVIFCMRDDKEKKLNKEYEKQIQNYIKSKGCDIEQQDTHIGDIKVNEREKELKKIWTKFSSAECVITDRLHGMIFCVITGTPCIAFNNSNGKVKLVYERWLKQIRYIRVVNNNKIEDFIKEYEKIQKNIKENKDKDEVIKNYKQMEKIINHFIENNKKGK